MDAFAHLCKQACIFHIHTRYITQRCRDVNKGSLKSETVQIQSKVGEGDPPVTSNSNAINSGSNV